MIKNILLGIAGSPLDDEALTRAAELAQIHDAEVTGVTIASGSDLPKIGKDEIGAERLDRAIEKFQSFMDEKNIQHKTHLEEGEPFSLLKDLWRYQDLTILGIRELFDLGLIEEPDQSIHHLIVEGIRPIVAVEQNSDPVEKGVVAYDGSMDAAKTMKQFVQMDPWPDVNLTIACFETPEEEAEMLLKSASNYCSAHGFDVETYMSEEPVREALLPFADAHGAELLILGDSARSLLFQKVFGDTALQALREADQILFLSH